MAGERFNCSSEDEKGITRRNFLKYATVAAGTVIAGASGLRVAENYREQHDQEVLSSMLKAPREKIVVGKWGEKLEEGEVSTVSELRAKAGWEVANEEEFEKALNLLSPGTIRENHVIEPGVYEVPVNKSEKGE